MRIPALYRAGRFKLSLENNNLTIDGGFKIRNHVIEKLDSEELTKTSYWQRIGYLLSNIDQIDKKIGDYDESIEECPFCGELISDSMRSCPTCGLSIREIDLKSIL